MDFIHWSIFAVSTPLNSCTGKALGTHWTWYQRWDVFLKFTCKICFSQWLQFWIDINRYTTHWVIWLTHGGSIGELYRWEGASFLELAVDHNPSWRASDEWSFVMFRGILAQNIASSICFWPRTTPRLEGLGIFFLIDLNLIRCCRSFCGKGALTCFFAWTKNPT